MDGDRGDLRIRRHAATRLEISEITVDLFASQGAQRTTVSNIANAAGVSERTFHRYFPTKEDAVSPALDAGWYEYVQAFERRPQDELVVDSLVAALEHSLNSRNGRRHRTFLRALPCSPSLRPKWLAVHAQCAGALTAPLAARLGLTPESIRAGFAAVCVVEANRIAVEQWAQDDSVDPGVVARECLDALSNSLLARQQRRE